MADDVGKPGAQTEAALREIYQRFERNNTFNRVEEPPPVVDKTDPWRWAKIASEKVTKFVRLAAETYRLNDTQIFFAVELTCLNVYNALDRRCPNEKRDAARKAAYDYYIKELPNAPDAPDAPTKR